MGTWWGTCGGCIQGEKGLQWGLWATWLGRLHRRGDSSCIAGSAINSKASWSRTERWVCMYNEINLTAVAAGCRVLGDVSLEPELSRNLPLAGKAARCHLHTNVKPEAPDRFPGSLSQSYPEAGADKSWRMVCLPFKWTIGIPVSGHRKMLLLLRCLLPLTGARSWGILCPGKS